MAVVYRGACAWAMGSTVVSLTASRTQLVRMSCTPGSLSRTFCASVRIGIDVGHHDAQQEVELAGGDETAGDRRLAEHRLLEARAGGGGGGRSPRPVSVAPSPRHRR